VPLEERFVALHPGANVVLFTVPPGAMPSAELRVVAIVPLDRSDSTSERLIATATQRIDVGTASHRLSVSVAPDRATYAPGDDVAVRVRVTDASAKGRRAEATIWAVDEGVGQLTGLTKPDLLAALFGSGLVSPWEGSSLNGEVLGMPVDAARLGANIRVRVRGMRTISGRIPSMLMENVVVTGYDAVAPDAMLRSKFMTTPLFAGAVETDADGVATTRFRLPDNVTTYRLFATAISKGMDAGSGDSTLVTARPLVVRPALPRIVRLGDTLLAGGVITQDAAGETPVSLSIDAQGIAVDGPHTLAGTLRDRRATELRFPMRVVSGDSVRVRLHGGNETVADAVERTLAVSAAGRVRAHVVSGQLEGRAELALPVVDGIDVERSSVMVQLGTSMLPLARQLSGALRVYPYDCTEQLTSAARALLARVSIERAAVAPHTLTERDRRQRETVVGRVIGRQTSEGGFGYWDREDWTSPWLTAYALETLLDARDVGVLVPDAVVASARAYLRRAAAEGSPYAPWTTTNWRGATGHEALAIARGLRRIGEPDSTLEQWLWRERGRMQFVDRLELALLRAAEGDSAGARALVDDAWRAVQPSGRKLVLDDSTEGWGWVFASRLRPLAHLLHATAVLEPRHPMLGALLETVVQHGRAERRFQWNTLDQSAVAEALASVRAARGPEGPTQVSVAALHGAPASIALDGGDAGERSFPLTAFADPALPDSVTRLTLTADATAPVYYAATLLEVPRARPVRADDEGISVERWYEDYDDAKPAISVREGRLVRVRLRVTVKGDREFVALEDPLPAGLEAVDVSLRTSQTMPPPRGGPRNERRSNWPSSRSTRESDWWSPWDHREMHDDRVQYFARQLRRGTYELTYVARATTVGTFVRPPAQAEEMYNPAVHGRSDGGVFTVTESR
jgi:uncharacterized protein YfaS (alpha-2-macroglobulin family)